MNGTIRSLHGKRGFIVALAVLSVMIMVAPFPALAQQASTPPEPVVAIHVSELTQALETIPNGWWTSWHYFVMPESMKEALRADGTPFVEVSDADIAAGRLRHPDGSPRYPIVISLAAEAIDDGEIAPLRDYVAAGGFLFVGSSAFTRNPDGTSRPDFALAGEMGLHMLNPSLQNWYENLHFSKIGDHRLAADIPAGTLAWRMPRTSDEVPLGVSPRHSIHGRHFTFRVSVNGATVIANGDSGPLLATRQYGKGNFIYHGAAQPLIGHTVYDPSLYAYLIYRRAIEWGFGAANLPIIKLSPWQYEYDAAFVVRHDFENFTDMIRSIEHSAAFEHSAGVRGDYYFCTGTLREEMADQNAVIASLRNAVTNYGATIGSHNGGLKNPVNLSLSLPQYDYWHWGPDEALDVTPTGYASGRAYAKESLSLSFQDIEGWMAGVDNGRAGCGAAGNCPRIWAAPYMNSTREESRLILEELDAKNMGLGEQKIGPFPHWTISYETQGKRFSHITEPASDWYVGAEVPGALEWGHTTASMQAAVDFYHNLGGMINLYGHIASSDSNLMGQYIRYCVSKPRMWAANAVGISDWWQVRSTAVVTPAYGATGNTAVASATITGATDPDTAVEMIIPGGNGLQVFMNGEAADPAAFRFVGNVLKIRVGVSTSLVEVSYSVNNPEPTTTGLSPATADAEGPDFTLTVEGTGFVTSSMVRWNGAERATAFVSSTQLTAMIPAADIAAAGEAQVTVFNPAPGGGISNAHTFTINNPLAVTWTQTDWAGGGGQSLWEDATRYSSADGIVDSVNGRISLVSTSTALFSDDFTRPPDNTDPLSPWTASMGTWTVTGGVLQGSGNPNQYSYASLSTAPQWTDYMVQGRIQMSAGSFGGGIGGRVDPATGAHYGAWVYPAGSAGGSNVLKLWKFRGWTEIGLGVPMQQVNLSDVGTGWHTLQMTFLGSRILVYYDGVLQIDATDNDFDSRSPYLSGGISVDWWTGPLPYTITVDDISVVTLPAYGSSGTLLSSAFDGGNGVEWQTVSWDAAAGVGTNVCVRTRTADMADQLTGASWSDCYGNSGSGFMGVNRRWIQYRLELATSDPAASPFFDEIRISTLPGTPGEPVPVINSLAPASAAAGGAAFTLTVNGNGFVASSVVRWNGADRATVFVSSTRLTAAIPAADIAAAGLVPVTVFTPAPGGGTSNAQTFTINNPAPATTSLSPAAVMAGGAGFTLTVNGSGFVASSVVRWNGAERATAFVSSTRLTAMIAAADIAAAGEAQVTVFNPAPGGGVSNAQTFTVDGTPPTVTSFLATTPSTSLDIPIASFIATDDVGVAGYMVTTSATPPSAEAAGWAGTAPAVHTVASDGTYTLYPWAKDVAGNVSEAFGTPRTVVVDTTAPDAPAVSGATPTNNTTPTWNWTTGGGGNGAYRFKLDDSDLTSGAATITGTSYTPASALSAAAHTLYVQERDDAGNWSTSGSFTITIDTTPPNAPSVLGATPTNNTTPTWNWTTGGGGNGAYRWKLDNSDLTSGAATTTGTSYTPASALTEGSHTLYVQERDDAGNWSVSGSFAVLIDTTLPPAPVVSGTTPTNDTTPTWSWMPGDGGSGPYRWKLDNSDLSTGATTTTAMSYTPASAQAEGSHTLYVQEQDDAGNWSASGSFAIVIDTTQPTVAISAPSLSVANSSVSVTYTLTYTGADTVTCAAGHVTLNRTGTANGTVAVSGGTNSRTVTISGIAGFDGTLGITIAANTASDAAGNMAAATGPSATFTVDNASGDFNGNGVEFTDALKALRITAGLDTPTGSDSAHGDVAPLVTGQRQPDGKIDLGDTVAILRKAVGLSSW